MAFNLLRAQIPTTQAKLFEFVNRPSSRRIGLLLAAASGLAVALVAVAADALGLGAEAGFGGLQGFGILTGICVTIAALGLAASMETRPALRPVALALGFFSMAAGLVVLGLLIFTSFFGLHESGRLRVIQFAYVEGFALLGIGARAAWVSGLGDSRLMAWLLPRLSAGWMRFDAGVTRAGTPVIRAGRRAAGESTLALPLGRILGRIPALDLALAGVLATWAVMSRFGFLESTRAVMVPAAYILVPFIPGYLALRVIERIRDRPAWDWTVPSRFFTSWFLGALFFTALTMTFEHTGFRWALQRLDIVYFALVGAGWLAVNVPDHRESTRVTLGDLAAPLRFHWPLFLVAFFSIWPRLITGYYNPFPQIERNFSDPRITSQDTLRMIQDGYLTLTNVSHPPGVVSITGTIARLLQIEPLSIMWAVSFGQFAIFATGLYALAWRLTQSRTIGVLTALFGLFVFSGSVGFEGTPLRLRSNTLIYSFLPLVLVVVHEMVTRVKPKVGQSIWGIGRPLIFLGAAQVVFFLIMNVQVFTPLPIEWRGMILLGAVVAVFAAWPFWRTTRFAWQGTPLLLLPIATWQLFHVYESPIFVASVLGFALILSLQRDERWGWFTFVVFGSCAAVLIGLAASEFLPSTTASRIIFGGTYDDKTGGVYQKLNLMDQATAAIALALFLFGVGIAVWKRSQHLLVALGMAALGYALYFFPDAHTVRAYKIITPFFSLLCAVGSLWLYTKLRERTTSAWLAPFVGVVGVVVIAFFITRPMQNHFSDIRTGQSFFSSLNDAEYAAIDWLHDNAGYDVRLLSDYQTMQLFNTVGNHPSLVERKYWPAEMTDAGRAQILFLRDFVLYALDPKVAHDNALTLLHSEPPEEKLYLETAGKATPDQRLFIVWSAKTSKWNRRQSTDPIFTPLNQLPDEIDLIPFQDPTYFTEVFSFGDFLYIWEVNQ